MCVKTGGPFDVGKAEGKDSELSSFLCESNARLYLALESFRLDFSVYIIIDWQDDKTATRNSVSENTERLIRACNRRTICELRSAAWIFEFTVCQQKANLFSRFCHTEYLLTLRISVQHAIELLAGKGRNEVLEDSFTHYEDKLHTVHMPGPPGSRVQTAVVILSLYRRKKLASEMKMMMQGKLCDLFAECAERYALLTISNTISSQRFRLVC